MEPTISKVGIVKSSEVKGFFPKTNISFYTRNRLRKDLPLILIRNADIRGKHHLEEGVPLRLIFSYRDPHNILKYDILDNEGKISSTHYPKLF